MKYVSRMGIPALAELYERMFPGASVKASDITVEEDKKKDCLIVTYPELAFNLQKRGAGYIKNKYMLRDFECPACLGDLGNPARELYFKYMIDTFGHEYLEDYLKHSMGLTVEIHEYKASIL